MELRTWSLPMGRRYLARYWFLPGTWMNDDGLSELERDILTITDRCLAERPRYGVFLGTREAFANRLVTVIRSKRSNRPVAMSALVVFPLEHDLGMGRNSLVHAGIVLIEARHQRKGLQFGLYSVPLLFLLIRNRFRGYWLSNVSQVPAIIGAVSSQFDDVYPHFAHSQSSPDRHRRIAKWLMERQRSEFGVGPEASFDDERFVIEQSYTGGSEPLKKAYDDCRLYKDQRCNRFCRDNLDYERGDDFLQIGVVDYRTFLRNILRITRTQLGLFPKQ